MTRRAREHVRRSLRFLLLIVAAAAAGYTPPAAGEAAPVGTTAEWVVDFFDDVDF